MNFTQNLGRKLNSKTYSKKVKRYAVLGLAVAAVALTERTSHAQTAANVASPSISEPFNIGTLSTAALPTGWAFDNNDTTYGGGVTAAVNSAGTSGAGVFNGSSTGGYYNLANGVTATSTERAIGILNSGNANATSPREIMYGMNNTTGQTISKVAIEWNYEKYRSGSRAFIWTFFSSATTNVTTAQTGGDQAYAADADNITIPNPPTQIGKSVLISGLNITNANPLYLRWRLTGVGGSTNGQALGIDDFNMWLGVPQLFWDGDGTGVVGGGTGTWDNKTTARFAATAASTTYGTWNNAVHDTSVVVFGGTAGTQTVTVGAPVSANGMLFNVNGYTVSGANAVTLSGTTPTITVTNLNDTASITAVLSGSTLDKAGNGTLVLGGSVANNYTGLTTVAAGILGLNKTGVNAIGSSGVTVSGGTLKNLLSDQINDSATVTVTAGSWDLNGLNETVATISGANGTQTITSTANAQLTVTGAGTYNGVISGGGLKLAKTTGGTLELGGTTANTFGGLTNISAGELDLNKTGVIAIAGDGVAASDDVTLGGGTLKWLQNNQLADDVKINMTNGTTDLNGKTDTIGALVNSGGTFTTGTGGHLIGTGASITWSGGTNTVADAAIVEDAHIIVSGGTNTVNGGATGGILQVNASGTGLEMNGGDLALASSNSVPGKLVLKGDVSTAVSVTSNITSSGALANRGVVDLNGGTRTISVGTASNLNVGALISNGGLIKTGVGTLTLTGASNYAGNTVVNGGVLNVANATGSATGTGTVTVNSGGTLAGTGKIDGPVAVNSGGHLAPGNSPGTLTINNSLQLGGESDFELQSVAVHDKVVGVSDISFGGKLTVSNFSGGPTYAVGQQFDLFDWSGSHSGSFTGGIVLPTLDPDLVWHDFGGSKFDYTTGLIQVDAAANKFGVTINGGPGLGRTGRSTIDGGNPTSDLLTSGNGGVGYSSVSIFDEAPVNPDPDGPGDVEGYVNVAGTFPAVPTDSPIEVLVDFNIPIGGDLGAFLANLEAENGSPTFTYLTSGPQFSALASAYAGPDRSWDAVFIFNTPGGATPGSLDISWNLLDATAGRSGFTVDKLAVVPEPSSIGLIAAGGLSLLAPRRRNRGKKK